MKNFFNVLKYILAGILFGIVMVKSEAASWYRIREMFLFGSFHMYGIIGTAVVTGIIGVYLIRRRGAKDVDGNPIVFPEKQKSIRKYLLGGTVFGLGWALTGACPGPLFVNLDYGYGTMAVAILAAWAGTAVYGMIRHKLPH